MSHIFPPVAPEAPGALTVLPETAPGLAGLKPPGGGF